MSPLQAEETFVCLDRHGDLDLSFIPAGTGGYEELIQNSVEIRIRGAAVRVASPEDVIRSKEPPIGPKITEACPF